MEMWYTTWYGLSGRTTKREESTTYRGWRSSGDGPAVLYVPLDNAGPDLLSLRLEAVGTRLAETRDLAPAKRKLARGRRRVPNRSSLTCGRSWTAYSLANGFGLT